MILFDRPEGCTNRHRNAVVDELGILLSQKLRLFRTFVPKHQDSNPAYFVFVTTHKDTALMFCTFSKDMLRHLGYLLLGGFTASSEPFMLVYKGGDSEDGWFVTYVYDHAIGDTFTFSPAQGRIS